MTDGPGYVVPTGPASPARGPAAEDRSRRRWSLVWPVLLAWVLGILLWFFLILTVELFRSQGADLPGWVDALLLLDVVLGQLAVGAALLRRRWPTAVALFTIALTGLSSMAFPAALLAAISLATHRRVPPLLALAGTGLAANVAWELSALPVLQHLPESAAYATGPLQSAVNVVVSTLVLAVCVLIGWNVGVRRELVDSWRLQARTAHREQGARVAQARLAERSRIAREMHDVLAHRLSVVAMHSGALAYREDLPREEVAATAETIRANAHTALEELREVLGVLRSEDVTGAAGEDEPDRAPQPDLSDIPALVAEAETRGERVRLEVPEALWAASVRLPDRTGRNAYRVVQEALTNARKHAPGEPVTVTLTGGPKAGLTVRVANARPDGQQHGAAPGAGLGLTGMAERIDLAGGRLEAGDHDGQFVVDAWLPWSAQGKPEPGDGISVAVPDGRTGR